MICLIEAAWHQLLKTQCYGNESVVWTIRPQYTAYIYIHIVFRILRTINISPVFRYSAKTVTCMHASRRITFHACQRQCNYMHVLWFAAYTSTCIHSSWHDENSCLHVLHYITLHYITSHHITSHHITSHHITSHRIASHRIASHRIASHHITLHYITLHYITLHYITLHYIIVISHAIYT